MSQKALISKATNIIMILKIANLILLFCIEYGRYIDEPSTKHYYGYKCK